MQPWQVDLLVDMLALKLGMPLMIILIQVIMETMETMETMEAMMMMKTVTIFGVIYLSRRCIFMP